MSLMKSHITASMFGYVHVDEYTVNTEKANKKSGWFAGCQPQQLLIVTCPHHDSLLRLVD